jgi:hypothetical protein
LSRPVGAAESSFDFATQGGARASLALGWLVAGPLALTHAALRGLRDRGRYGVFCHRKTRIGLDPGFSVIAKPVSASIQGFLSSQTVYRPRCGVFGRRKRCIGLDPGFSVVAKRASDPIWVLNSSPNLDQAG